jgi:hypothetical protein
MAGNTFAAGIQVVRVTDNTSVDGVPVRHLWVAAVPRDEAAAAVQKRIPADWTAELTDRRLTPEHIARLKLRPGDVCELSSAE